MSSLQYNVLASPPLPALTQRDLFDYQVEFWMSTCRVSSVHFTDLVRHIPATGLFLVVPERRDDCLGLIKLKTGSAYTNLQPDDQVRDEPLTLMGAYLAIGVQDGREFLPEDPHAGANSADAELKIRELGRSSYTLYEGIVHALVFPVLEHHGIVCCGSLLGRHHLGVRLFQGHPRIETVAANANLVKHGFPSCLARLRAPGA